ncbi:MAG: acyl-CoA desaturase [Desulfobacteraceae bacterium]
MPAAPEPSGRTYTSLRSLYRWFDSRVVLEPLPPPRNLLERVLRYKNYLAFHLVCLGVIWVGWSWTAVVVAAWLYLLRMFAITGFYHRYFSHRTFTTSRFWQFVFAVWGNTAAQRGPLWWASHHRHHHRHTDQEQDVHSPSQHGFWWSHIGWLTNPANLNTKWEYVQDWAKFPELVWLDRFDKVVPLALAVLLYFTGDMLAEHAPQLMTSGPQLLIWGFFISTVALFHGTCTINSLSHVFGWRRYNTADTSRNNQILALITLGEGWHNNHHHYAISARQGFFWWEIDITYYLLVGLSKLGIIQNLRPVPPHLLRPSHSQASSVPGRGHDSPEEV